MKFTATLALLLSGSAFTTSSFGKEIPTALPAYTATKTPLSGSLKSIGSDSMNNEMTLWAEGFAKYHKNVKIEIEGKGSATAPTALIAGTAQFGPMSRPIKQEEIESFKAKFAYEPTAVKTSLDVLAVYVHRDNPIQKLTSSQIDAAFSKTRKGGSAKDVVTWGDLGAKGEWASKPIQLYGRNSASGTYGFFKEHALFKGDFKDTVKEQPGSAAVIQAISNDKFALGYSGIGYKTEGVKALAVSAANTQEFFDANRDNAYSGKYPLARYLILYLNKKPKEAMDPLRSEFLKYVLSSEGQGIVEKEGYFPLTKPMLESELKKLGMFGNG